MGEVIGYTLADYLFQFGRRQRRSACVPDRVWSSLTDYVLAQDPQTGFGDVHRLADSAWRRMCYEHALKLYGSSRVATFESRERLADLLARRDEIKALQRLLRDVMGHRFAEQELARIYAARGRGEDALNIVYTADVYQRHEDTYFVYLELLVEQRRAAELEYQEHSESNVTRMLDKVLACQGNIEKLRERAAKRHPGLAVDESVFLHALNTSEHIDRLRARAEAGHVDTRVELWDFLAERMDLSSLVVAAHEGDLIALYFMVEVLVKRGDFDMAVKRIEEIRQGEHRADLPQYAAVVVELLRAATDPATPRLAGESLSHIDQYLDALIDDMHRRKQAPLPPAALSNIRAGIIPAPGSPARPEETELAALQARADDGNWHDSRRLLDRISRDRRLEPVMTEIHAGTREADNLLLDMLSEHGIPEPELAGFRAFGLTGEGLPVEVKKSAPHPMPAEG
jgi:hypothetical protein